MCETKRELNKFMFNPRARGEPKAIDSKKLNDNYIIAIYKGKHTDFDFRIGYREKNGDNWRDVRQPRHIHWAIEILLKRYKNKRIVTRALKRLLELWWCTEGVHSYSKRNNVLKSIPLEEFESFKEYTDLYFWMIFIYLLMIQEKTNYDDSNRIPKILQGVLSGKDNYSIISTVLFTKK